MTDSLPALGAAWLTGLLGSAHCLGMCAGMSGLFAVRAEVTSLRSRLALAAAYNAGRLVTYALLGLLVATLGSKLVAAIPAAASCTVRLSSP